MGSPPGPPDEQPAGRIQVVVGDAQRLFAEALSCALRASGPFDVCDECPQTGSEAIRVVAEQRPDVAVVDFWFPDMDGAAIVRTLGRGVPSVKVLVLSWLHGPAQVNAVLMAGAAGYLPKNLRLEQLVDAVQRAASGERPVYAREVARLVTDITDKAERAEAIGERLASLTPREVEILRLLNGGGGAKQVAAELGITVGTVKNHLHKILGKTRTSSQAEVLAMARRGKLILDTNLPPHPPHAGPHWVG